MAFDVTTEWADIHRRLGNYVPLEPKVTQEELMNKAIDVAEGIDPLKYKTAEQLKEMEEDNIDDEFIREWRAKRLAEAKSTASRHHFRHVFEISKQDYVQEICEAGEGIYVLLHLYQDYIPACRAINAAFESLCEKFSTYKFVKIIATRCVENFRDGDCPTILIYRSGQPVKQFAACESLFGPRITPESIEWKLFQEGIWETDLESPPDDRFHVKRITRRKNSDSDDDHQDREYTSTHMPRRY